MLILLTLMMLILIKMIQKLIFMPGLWLGVIEISNANHGKKDVSKELMPVALHPTRWWDWCMLEDEKKEKVPIFTDKK